MNHASHNNASEIWIVDDSVSARSLLSDMLNIEGYRVFNYERPEDALSTLSSRHPHVIISDIRMPGMDGLELLVNVRKIDKELPFLLMTAYPEFDDAIKAIECGVFDFMIKPIRKEHILLVVRRALEYRNMVLERKEYAKTLEDTVHKRSGELDGALNEIKSTNVETILVLTNACEYRDDETGSHIRRIGLYACRIAEEMRLDHHFCEMLLYSAPMHDVGKIGIPNSILLKPGPLNTEEFEVIKSHTKIGARLFSGCKSELLKAAGEVALFHHEKYDGTGYPKGLKGSEIPLSARIVMLADVYDALRSERPYRKGLSHKDAFRSIIDGDGRTMPHHFDPTVLKAFISAEEDFDRLFNEHRRAQSHDTLMRSGYVIPWRDSLS